MIGMDIRLCNSTKCFRMFPPWTLIFGSLSTFFMRLWASFISQITTLCNYVPPLLWLMCRNNPKRGGTDRHEIHETARYRHCSPRPHCRASVSGSGCVRGDHSDSQVLSSLAAVRLQTALAVDAALRTGSLCSQFA